MMEGEHLRSWEDFEDRISELSRFRIKQQESTRLYVSDVLFRGQSNSQWGLLTTLERYSGLDCALYDYYRKIFAAKPIVESFTGKKWQILTPPEYEKWLEGYDPLGISGFEAYDYMAYLRHHGFPSPLLDWTRSPYVAAYFAFRDVLSTADSVAIFAYIEDVGQGKGVCCSEGCIRGLGPYVTTHKRHFLQHCEYTICSRLEDSRALYTPHESLFCKGADDQDFLRKFILPASERTKILKRLDLQNVHAYSLFESEESLMETIALREFRLRGADF